MNKQLLKWFSRMPNQRLTIKVITDTGSVTRDYATSLRAIRNMIIVGVVLVILFVVGIISIVKSVYTHRELTYLEMRNAQLERQALDVAELRNELAEIWIINGRLLRMLGGETSESVSRPATRSLPWGCPLSQWAGSSFRILRTNNPDRGVTFETQPNVLVIATADGVVRDKRWNAEHGDMLIVEHGEGIQTVHGRDVITLVNSGENVVQGQVLGVMNDAEGLRKPLLHYRVMVDGASINPLSAMSEPASEAPLFSMIALP